MKRTQLSALLLSGMMLAVAQVKKEDLGAKNTASPGAETSVTVNGKNIWIYYHASSVRGRHIFVGAGALQPYGKVWRLGADLRHCSAHRSAARCAVPRQCRGRNPPQRSCWYGPLRTSTSGRIGS